MFLFKSDKTQRNQIHICNSHDTYTYLLISSAFLRTNMVIICFKNKNFQHMISETRIENRIDILLAELCKSRD
jgi:hypothetical protein